MLPWRRPQRRKRWQRRLWPSKAAAGMAFGDKATAVELVAVKALSKKAVGEKAKAVEVVAAKSVEEQVCASKATITMQQSKEGKNTATGQKLTSSDTEIVAKHKGSP